MKSLYLVEWEEDPDEEWCSEELEFDNMEEAEGWAYGAADKGPYKVTLQRPRTKMTEKKVVPTKTEDKALETIDWKKEMEASTKMMMEQEKPDNQFISFKSGVLSFNDQVAEGNAIECVIVGSAFENAYYPNRYDPDKIVYPECWATSLQEADLAPDKDLVDSPEHPTCDGCPKNEWASDPNGGKGKACKNIRRLGLIQAHQVENPAQGMDLLFAKLPVTSVVNWKKYVVQLGNVVRRPPWAVVTKLSTVPSAKTQFQVNFEFVRILEEPAMEPVHRSVTRIVQNNTMLFPYPKNDAEDDEKPAAKGKTKF